MIIIKIQINKKIFKIFFIYFIKIMVRNIYSTANARHLRIYIFKRNNMQLLKNYIR